jgi:bifunctional DNA-binding transcriptional regulator/antitoxin component of YhaV-PrlF toxin-antitoxin module
MRHSFGMAATIILDASGRLVIPRDIRRAPGIPPGQRLKLSATPGRIIIEVEANPGKDLKRGKLKTWSGKVPSMAIEEAVELVRHYER